MKNTFGNSISLTIFGESHGEYIGATLDGLAPGIEIDRDLIGAYLDRRRPEGKISTSRREADEYRIVSGVFNEKTTGTPLTVLIPNSVQRSSDYEKTRSLARPGHADFAAFEKYHGFEDYRGGGHFSGRITAALVAAGAILISALKKKNIRIATHIKAIGSVCDRDFGSLESDIEKLSSMKFPALDDEKALLMRSEIEKAAEAGDSVGGILETVITGVPAGVGEPWFDTLEGVLAHALFSVPAVKGVQFGNAFSEVLGRGSEYNDAFCIREGKVVTKTNHNGGINGGISNGMPIVFSCAVKPTPSIFKEQDTIDISKQEEAKLSLKGRHDPCVVHRAAVVTECVAALAVADMLALRYGTDWMAQ